MTNSRDTQELLPEAGHEMLRIFFTHPARTSLLQDFAFYEVCIEFDGPFFFCHKTDSLAAPVYTEAFSPTTVSKRIAAAAGSTIATTGIRNAQPERGALWCLSTHGRVVAHDARTTIHAERYATP